MDDDFDEIDRRLAHALALDGRAPFSLIAEVAEVSERTVARRYTRLRSTGTIRVVGRPAAVATGAVEWFLRVRCAPSAAVAVAEALARRPDTSWVMLTSGGTEIVCAVRAEHDTDSETLLLDRLPRTSRVEAVSAHSVLHTFYGGAESPVAKLGPLDAAAAARLRPAPPDGPGGPVRLDDGDRELVAALADDGRSTYEQLAARTGWSASTVRRRLHELRRRGAVHVDLDVDPRLFGRGVRTLCWFSVPPADLAPVGEALAGHAEVAFAAATTGPTNLCATVLCADQRGVYRYLTEQVATLPSVAHVETAPVIRIVKEVGGGTVPRARPRH
ncbi:Transcriptional regulator, AsnC family [Pseudonocardia sp. Ae406_Ps2]|uniref:Lrp/AsnC family transcriptional regulator n=1 Tax=unclassified Pseudonocardia TaxID=2619320 RepID=UPI00094B1F88|nr:MULTISPECIES: AsnC family transcriptional regulator [unclassified Pseudonocardia]OLM01668.1 Transcriptional regulator, AsnC family [Pseudonocardia sp. Ae406_Ps2]OLM06548.1 Transcriptional regulator, AsnC family [Pseudonocardia sp. Ae331_Ps2]OLM13287.1 Transcriptional regulator, AsnC family [Pseudonocardia sp. Ae505_Ps2]OLM23239.1 Transcriptional regulator, AsnC family [Pseudonocardia sp. Ae706_Ps2]OLM32300.1 Transcriptional regulator, AsnC family [Pseudonocardia sp. Ae717_Ps2]